MHKYGTYSLKKRAFWYWMRILVMFSVLLLFLILYISKQLQQETYNGLHQTMDLYAKQLSGNMKTAEDCLWEFANNNTDVVDTITSRNSSNAVISQIKAARLLDNTLSYMTDIDGMFVYGKINDYFVCRYKNGGSNDCSTYIKNTLRQSNDAAGLNTKTWYYMRLDCHTYLVRIINDLHGYLGAWIRLDELSIPFDNTNTVLLFADENGIPYDKKSWSNIQLSTDFSSKKLHQIRREDGKRYLQVAEELPLSTCSINALIPFEEVNTPIFNMLKLLSAGALLIFIVSLLWTFSYEHLISKPLSLIRKMASQVKEEQQVPHPDLSNERCEEVLELGETLNKLMNRIEKLKINVYEDKLNLKALEIQYLKSQVAPHFLINCLSAIGSMPFTEEGRRLTNEFIRALSDHIRYTLQDKTAVPLSEELKYVENYLKLTALRFPECLKWEIDVAEECRNASVFPIILLMFTENTIKHNMIMGEELRVRITGSLVERNDEKYVVLIHLDSGSGYFEADLEYLNRPVSQQVHDFDGKKIGTYNLLKRLYLVYGEKAHVHFSNEPGWGAKSEITIPYIPYREDDDPPESKIEKSEPLFSHAPDTPPVSGKKTRAKACLKRAFRLAFCNNSDPCETEERNRAFTMNILVVDDEYYIVKNIIETTDWSTLGIEQAFPAYSASQAKRLFEGSQDIDILLTDIEMPRETGLQLVEWLHENDFHPIVLVLTGHQRFDYAQEALNLHIFSYLLKPIDPDQLTEKLAAAVQEVKKNAWYEKERLNMEEHLSTNTSDPISVIKDYIRSHLSDPELGRTSIAEEIHMNPDYLSHIFSTKAGASLSSYIMDERMAAAKRLLATTGFSPQQICDQIGIANVSYFYRQFKKSSGVTPQQYRERHFHG